MKRKTGKTMVDVRDGVSLVHLNVSSGYLTYIEENEASPRVKNVVLEAKESEDEST